MSVQTTAAHPLAEFLRPPALQEPAREAWDVLAGQDDVASVSRWAEAVLSLLHANAGAACMMSLLRLRDRPAALVYIDAWATLGAPGLSPALRRLEREAAGCVALAARSGTSGASFWC